MKPADWLDRVQCLAARFSDYGIDPDLAGLAAVDLWGLYLFLSRIADGAGA